MFIGKYLLPPPHALGEVGVNVNEITANNVKRAL
jgi:hypothetical protein